MSTFSAHTVKSENPYLNLTAILKFNGLILQT